MDERHSNRHFWLTTWENELELPVWPMWLQATTLSWPHMWEAKCPGTIFSTSSKTHRSGFHFKRVIWETGVFFFGKQKWLFEGWGANRSKSLAFFSQHLGHQCVESWASRFTCFTSLSFGRACEAALLRWWWMRSSGLKVKWESSGFHWI